MKKLTKKDGKKVVAKRTKKNEKGFETFNDIFKDFDPSLFNKVIQEDSDKRKIDLCFKVLITGDPEALGNASKSLTERVRELERCAITIDTANKLIEKSTECEKMCNELENIYHELDERISDISTTQSMQSFRHKFRHIYSFEL